MATPSGLAALFLAGFAIRLIFARGGGFPYDMSSFGAWAGTLADKGPWNFYPFDARNPFFVDYPPGYLYVLWILGLVSKALKGSGPSVFMIKLPAMLADLALAWVVGLLAERVTPPAVPRRLPIRAIAAAAILLNPAVIFISAVWGQADAVLAVLVVGSFLLLGTGTQTLKREAGGVALLAVAFGTKPQAIFVVPIVILLLVWRHMRVEITAGYDPADRRRTILAGARRIATLAGIAVISGFVLFAPFRLFPARAFEFYVHSSRTYKITSVFAFNFWGAVGFWKPDSGDAADAVRILGVPAVVWGIVGFIALGGLVGARAWRALREGHDEGRVLVFGGVAITLVSFAVVTRVHERYLFLPLALLAVLVGNLRLRRAFVVLSGLYLLNAWFPYVYYLDFMHRPSLKFGGLYNALYGTDINGGRIRLVCVIVGGACLVIASRGWRAFQKPDPSLAPDEIVGMALAGAPQPRDVAEADVLSEPEPVERPPWSLRLHPVGRRGALIALAVFLVAFLMRVAGLGHPPGMFFDEVYHARAGAEYLGHKEVFEYTHPPLAKEIIGFAIQHMSGFNAQHGAPLPKDVAPGMFTSARDGMVWARNSSGSTTVERASLDGACNVHASGALAKLDMTADAIATSDTSVFVAGRSADIPQVVRLQDSSEAWRATLPSPAREIVAVGDRVYVVTEGDELVTVTQEGDPETLALGAGSIASDTQEAWVTFPSERKISSWDGTGKRTETIDTAGGEPGAITTHRGAERAFVSVGSEIIAYDTQRDVEQARIAGPAKFLGTVPETNVVWAVDDSGAVRAIEPLSAVVIGNVLFNGPPERITADPVKHRLVAVSPAGVECAGGRPQFAWRFGSAVMGAAMVAFLFLLALRLFGNILLALLASLFLAIDGLAFTMSRIAMNDSYATGFVIATWFCAASALYAWGRRHTDDPEGDPHFDRRAAIGWLFAAGLLGGMGLASKWPALYALAGIGLLMAWDGFDRKERSIWRVAGPFLPSAALVGVALVAVPLAVYFVSYLPYMSLGHTFADTLRLQRGMFEYHATLKATHPYSSPFFGWPFGYRAVYLYVHTTATGRAEIWTFPNLVVFWGGLVGLGAAAMRVYRSRSVTTGLVVWPAIVQYLPWILVGRVTFLYHYLPVVPFLAFGLAWFLVEGLRDQPYQRRVIIGTVALAIAFFAFSYPILVGWNMPVKYFDFTRVFSWVIP